MPFYPKISLSQMNVVTVERILLGIDCLICVRSKHSSVYPSLKVEERVVY